MGVIRRKEDIEHIDTNIVIRLIVGDDPKNYKKARKLMAKKHKTFIFEDSAMMEVVFILSKIYKYSFLTLTEVDVISKKSFKFSISFLIYVTSVVPNIHL